MDIEYDEAEKDAGMVGVSLARTLTGHVIGAVDGFPDSSPRQRASIVALIRHDLDDYVTAQMVDS